MTGSDSEQITLNNGQKMPVIAFGTFWASLEFQAIHEDARKAIVSAIDVGYRHIDTAYLYNTEKAVGLAIADRIKAGVVKRQDLFITTKLWSTYMQPDRVALAMRKSLKNLGLDYVDLYLVHWPTPVKPVEESDPPTPGDFFPTDKDGYGIWDDDVDYLDTWKEMEKLVDLGLTKSIGISNFSPEQIDRVVANCRIKPAVNQIEVSPYRSNKKFVDGCVKHGIAVSGYRTFLLEGATSGSPTYSVSKDKTLLEIGSKYKKSPFQVVERFLYQRGLGFTIKSANPQRQKNNLEIFDFKLAEDEVKAIWALDVGHIHQDMPVHYYATSRFAPV